MSNVAKKESHYVAFADDISVICEKMQEFLVQVQNDVNEFNATDAANAMRSNFQFGVCWGF
jgi:hypothetical protein